MFYEPVYIIPSFPPVQDFVRRLACAKFSVNTEEMWCNDIIGREHRKEEKNGKTKEIPVDE